MKVTSFFYRIPKKNLAGCTRVKEIRSYSNVTWYFPHVACSLDPGPGLKKLGFTIQKTVFAISKKGYDNYKMGLIKI